jgi:hypothetical protein
MASYTSAKLVLRGARPSRMPSGARKSVITPRAHSSSLTWRKSARRMVTCEPRRWSWRGEARLTPRPASQASTSSIVNRVSASDLARTAPIPASASIRTLAHSGTMARIGGVPLRMRRTPSAGS